MTRVTEAAHRIVAARLRAGDTAVDATAGNGHDTVFLARAVGPAGRVIAFDIQATALASTSRRLEGEGLLNRVTLVRVSHERIAEFAPPGVAAIMFNLGFLPGGDKSIVTGAATTAPALRAAIGLLRGGGVCTAVAYPGHPGGAEEAEAALRLAESVSQGSGQGVRLAAELPRRTHPTAPFLLAFERLRRPPSGPEEKIFC